MTPVGHAFIKRLMKEQGGALAGELSSHFYFADFFGVECADAVLLLLASILTGKKQSLSSLVAPYRTRSFSGEKNFSVHDKDALLARVEERYATSAMHVSHLDGLRCDFSDWWFSVRCSNTEPLVRLVLEADTEEVRMRMQAEVTALLTAASTG
jgi:phosphomannomutase